MALLLWLLASCAEKVSLGDSNAAVVNGKPISVAEVDFVFRQQSIPGESDEAAAARRRAILSDLVRTELLAQYAQAQEYDREGDWAAQEKLARRQILASLVTRNNPAPTPAMTLDSIRRVIAANPLAFKERKLLTLDAMDLVTPDEGLFDRLDAAALKGMTLDHLEEIAKKSSAATTRNVRSIGTDQLPIVVAKALLAAKPGVSIIVKGSQDRGVVLMLKSAIPAPIAEDMAERIVASDFSGRTRRAGLEKLIDQQLAFANIEYSGLFSGDSTRQAKADQRESVGLPVQNIDLKRKIILRYSLAASLSAAAVALGVLAIFWSARWMAWYGLLKVSRRIGLELTPVEGLEDVTERPKADVLSRMAFFPLFLMGFFSCAVLFHLVHRLLGVWSLLGVLIVGILVGVTTTRWTIWSAIRKWSRDKRWWPPVIFSLAQWCVAAIGIFLLGTKS